MEPVNLHLPADLAVDLASFANADGRTIPDEAVALLRRAVASRRLRELLDRCGSDLGEAETMSIALEEQKSFRRSR